MLTARRRNFTLSAILIAITILGLGLSTSNACFMRSPQPVVVWMDHINVDITDQVAVKKYRCAFKNPNAQAVIGGECFMELEPGAQVDNMTVKVDGKVLEAEILGVKKANEVFQDIVRNGGSPALLEYYGNQLIRTKVPKISANGTVMVELTYTTVLPRRGGLIRLQMLNTNPKALQQALKSAGVTVNIRSKEAIKNIYSPTHPIKLVEKTDWDISVQWSQENYLPKNPFVLYYQLAEQTVGASLITHQEPGEDGTFMLMISPTFGTGAGQITEQQILPKDVVFCVDTSGSMLQGNKMQQAQKALDYCINSLRKGDRFNIIDFSTIARGFHDEGLVDFNEQTKSHALKYVDNMRARGGTAIQEALEKSLKHLGSGDRLKMIVFATDGLPTIGERNPQAILKKVSQTNKQNVRIFVFGEGYDVNTKLLDFLAVDHRGEADYILPDEDINKKISQFFDRVGSPIMTDLQLTINGVSTHDVYPPRVPDVFKSEQVILYGRYSGSGPASVTVTGTLAGQRQTFEFPVEFPGPADDDRSAFVPRLWAGQKIDFLLSEMRQSGATDTELVDEITKLAMEYGIITPYTSFLVTDDLATTGPGAGALPIRGRARAAFGKKFKALKEIDRKLQQSGQGNNAATPALSEGEAKSAVEQNKKQAEFRRDLRGQGNILAMDEAAEMYFKQSGQKGSALSAIRYIGSRTFYKRGKEWQQSNFEPTRDKNIRNVVIGSEEYLQLLAKQTGLAKQLALGEVVLQIGKDWYRFQNEKS